MERDIWQLTSELIEEYRQDGYEANHLQPGDWVWCDDELFVTLDDLQTRIGELEGALHASEWPESWRQDLETLHDALRRLRTASRQP